MSEIPHNRYVATENWKAWYLDHQIHRLDGPAIIHANGGKEWRQNGKLHRLDGPAYIGPNGLLSWFINGIRHRLDGPAILYSCGLESWYINDRRITNEELDWIAENYIPFDPSLRTVEQTILHRLRWI